MTYIENWEKVLHRCCVLLGHGQFGAAIRGDTQRLRQTKFLLIAGARKRIHGTHTQDHVGEKQQQPAGRSGRRRESLGHGLRYREGMAGWGQQLRIASLNNFMGC